MLEIKAFIRVNVVDKVIQALEAAGISNIIVIDVRAIWTGLRTDRPPLRRWAGAFRGGAPRAPWSGNAGDVG